MCLPTFFLNLLSSQSLALCNRNPRPSEMTLKEWAMLFHMPHLYACCSNWNTWANSNASLCMCVCVCVCVCVCAQSLPLCLTLCDPMGYSLPVSSVHGLLQARIVEWVSMPSSRGSFQPRDWAHASCIARRYSLPLSHQLRCLHPYMCVC